MRELWLYEWLAKSGRLNYRAKIMLMAFLGTHIPLISLAGYVALRQSAEWRDFIVTMAVALVATLVGTVLTLLVLNHLLRPVLLTSRTLRSYRQSREIGYLPRHHTDEVGTLMADAADTLAHLESAIDTLEHLDAATGLPNRSKLVKDLRRRMQPGARVVACALRLGNYSRLLETFDLGTADAAAREIVARLTAKLPDTETLYRVGGADFMFLASGELGGADAMAAIGERLRGLLASSTQRIAAGTVTVETVLLGAVAAYPDDANGPDELIDNAIAAVALTSEDMRVSFHSPDARRGAVERLQLEQDLRRAIAADEFVLHYQPVIDLSVGRTIGAEALIRWQRPGQGLVQPGNFIAAAEASGLIDSIGLWVMRKACLQVREWNQSGLAGMKVAINLSARQFLDPNLVGFVAEAVGSSGIAADQLEIELTETAAMVDHEHTRAVFGRLRDLGVSIAIDDFGTGYAGMSYLRKLPFDKLKIDREFVTNVHKTRDSQAICGALVELAKGLGLRVLAEGTELEEEVRYLRARGCDLYQGYYFSRPVPAADFLRGVAGFTRSAAAINRPMAEAASA